MSTYETQDDKIVVTHEQSKATPTVYDGSVYTPTNRATGTQQEVANMWARGDLPTHKNGEFYTSTRNFRGKQYPDGHGELIHYATLAAVRTLNQLVLTNSEDYARGWATVTYPHKSACPNNRTHHLPLSTMARPRWNCPPLKHVTEVHEGDHSDEQGYDTMVVYNTSHTDEFDGDETCYRAASDKFDDDPLPADSAREFVDHIKGVSQ